MSKNPPLSEAFSIGISSSEKQLLENDIVSGLQSHHLAEPESWPEFVITAVTQPQKTTDNNELFGALSQATASYDQIWVSMDIADSSIPFLTRVKQNFHSLTLFYVNKLGEKQTRFNDRILRVANSLARKQLQQEAEIAELKEQIAQLQATITEMEQKH